MSVRWHGVKCAWALMALGTLSGCSSSYKPVHSPRASLVMDGGSPRVVRDGEDMGGFTFGGGVVDAVQSNPRAADEARTGRKLIIGGFVVTLAGAATEVGGVIYAIDHRQQDPGTGLAITLGGAAIALVGTIMVMNGQPHLYDAINIYNDGLVSVPAAPSYSPGWAPAPPLGAPPPAPSAVPPTSSTLPPPPSPPPNSP